MKYQLTQKGTLMKDTLFCVFVFILLLVNIATLVNAVKTKPVDKTRVGYSVGAILLAISYFAISIYQAL